MACGSRIKFVIQPLLHSYQNTPTASKATIASTRKLQLFGQARGIFGRGGSVIPRQASYYSNYRSQGVTQRTAEYSRPYFWGKSNSGAVRFASDQVSETEADAQSARTKAAAADAYATSQSSSKEGPGVLHDEESEEEDEQKQVLRAALSHVPRLGWTEAAIAAGAADVGLSLAIAGFFSHQEAALVEFFMDECNQALVEELESRKEEMANMVLQDRIAAIVWLRLEMQIPYISKWAQALSIQVLPNRMLHGIARYVYVQANPIHVPTTVKQRALLIDNIWHAAGDRSVDLDWYAKRALLSGVLTTTELYMVTDSSPGYRETRAFLVRRIKDAVDCRKTLQEAGQLTEAVGAGLKSTVNSFLKSRWPSSSGL